jgi:predicted phosphodiesterase
MYIALISDIHGNLVALEAVLASIQASRIGQIVCLGDVATSGPQPREVIEKLRKMDIPIAMGNMDAWMLDPKPHAYRDEDTRRITEIELWGAEQLAPSDISFLRTFPPRIEVPLSSDVNLLCVHASPRSDSDQILATTPDDELERMLAGCRATVVAGGHTHTQMLRRFRETTVINPGSVGLPIERSSLTGEVRSPPWAEYAVVGLEDGKLRIEFRRVPFDVGALVQTARASGMPHAEWWISNWRFHSTTAAPRLRKSRRRLELEGLGPTSGRSRF